MRHHIRCFESEQAYRDYKFGDDVWLPRVAFVPSTPTPIEQITEETPGRLIFHQLGEHFIEVCNGGTMYFFDKYDADNDEWYTATHDSSTGELRINVPDDKYTYDSSTGELNFTNFPYDDYDDIIIDD